MKNETKNPKIVACEKCQDTGMYEQYGGYEWAGYSLEYCTCAIGRREFEAFEQAYMNQ